tara:strand:- start:612 stop:878 length:267 start_codon:yes stop_codon:yes gene_type:complete
MMKKLKTITELKTYVNSLEQKLGSKAPCAAWIITNDDLMTEGEDTVALEKVPATDAKMILEAINMEDHSYVVEVIEQVVENELTTRGF